MCFENNSKSLSAVYIENLFLIATAQIKKSDNFSFSLALLHASSRSLALIRIVFSQAIHFLTSSAEPMKPTVLYLLSGSPVIVHTILFAYVSE